jgi:hypothetical protein
MNQATRCNYTQTIELRALNVIHFNHQIFLLTLKFAGQSCALKRQCYLLARKATSQHPPSSSAKNYIAPLLSCPLHDSQKINGFYSVES